MIATYAIRPDLAPKGTAYKMSIRSGLVFSWMFPKDQVTYVCHDEEDRLALMAGRFVTVDPKAEDPRPPGGG